MSTTHCPHYPLCTIPDILCGTRRLPLPVGFYFGLLCPHRAYPGGEISKESDWLFYVLSSVHTGRAVECRSHSTGRERNPENDFNYQGIDKEYGVSGNRNITGTLRHPADIAYSVKKSATKGSRIAGVKGWFICDVQNTLGCNLVFRSSIPSHLEMQHRTDIVALIRKSGRRLGRETEHRDALIRSARLYLST